MKAVLSFFRLTKTKTSQITDFWNTFEDVYKTETKNCKPTDQQTVHKASFRNPLKQICKDDAHTVLDSLLEEEAKSGERGTIGEYFEFALNEEIFTTLVNYARAVSFHCF